MTVPAPSPAPKPGSTAEDALDRLEVLVIRRTLAPSADYRGALATVRGEIERLRSVKAIAQIKELLERADAAEAEARTNFFNMEAERQGREHFENEANALRIEKRRLTEGLRELHSAARSYLRYPTLAGRFDTLNQALNDTDALLSASPSDGGGA